MTKQIEDESMFFRVSNLQAAIAFEEDDTAACRTKLEECPQEDPNIVVNLGCCLLKEGQFEVWPGGKEEGGGGGWMKHIER